MQHIEIKIFGTVQGVFFRDSTKQHADRLHIKGFVRNELDGSVYIEAEGSEKNLDEFIAWCEHGPDTAMVDYTDVVERPAKHFTDFHIEQ